VILNTAALLQTAGLADGLLDGARMARESLASGKAAETLARFVEASRD
jgi:anthranilate phosphoribosyltransferase